MTEQNLDLDLDPDLTPLRGGDDDPEEEEAPHALEWAWTGSGVATGTAPPIAADRSSSGPAQRGRRPPQRRESRATRDAMASRAPFLATEAGSSDDNVSHQEECLPSHT